MIVLDANILVRAVLGRRVRHLLETYSGRSVRFFAPDGAFEDVRKYLPLLLEKRGKSAAEVPASIEYLQNIIEVIEPDVYRAYESDARQRLRSRDEQDWPVLAAALALSCGVWTEDSDFFGTGVAVWTTSNIEIFLEAQAESGEPEV